MIRVAFGDMFDDGSSNCVVSIVTGRRGTTDDACW